MITGTGTAYLRERPLALVFFVAGVLLAAYGFATNQSWQNVDWSVAALLAAMTLASVLLAYFLWPALCCSRATCTALIWLIGPVYFWGFSAVLSTALIYLSAVGLGSIFVSKESPSPATFSALVGAALLCGTLGWLLPFPLHSRLVYLCCLSTVVALRLRQITSLLASSAQAWSRAVEDSPAMALAATAIVGSITVFAWLPTIGNDDLTYHVSLPIQLARFRYYHMDPASSIWALSAWAADVLQGVGRVLAESDSRGPIDILWLLLTLAPIWGLTRHLTRNTWLSWFAVALYAGLATVASELSSMQTEGPSAAVVAGLAFTIQSTETPTKRTLLGTAAVFGLLIGLKVSNILFALPLGLWLLWRWRPHLRLGVLSGSVITALLVAGSSYAYSYALSGNPVLPFFNKYFASPYFPASNFADTRWMTGLNWRLLWDLAFHTSRFTESYDGTAGFFLVALAGSLIVALASARTRPLAIVSIAALLLPLSQLQYLRYATPSFALLIPAMLSGSPARFPEIHGSRITVAGLIAILAADLLFVSARDWQVRQGVLSLLFTDNPSAVVEKYAPERKLAEYTNYIYGDTARVLLAGKLPCFGAPFAGTAFVSCWYDPKLQAAVTAANEDPDGSSWSSIFKTTGVNLLILRREDLSLALSNALGASNANHVYSVGDAQLWELRPSEPGTLVPAPPKAVATRFDTSGTPSGPAFVHAEITMQCTPSNVPIVMAWLAKDSSGKEFGKYRWVFCTPQGVARDSLDQNFERKVVSLTVQAQPGYDKDLSLRIKDANSHFRRDLMGERDLGKQIQHGVISLLKGKLPKFRATATDTPPSTQT